MALDVVLPACEIPQEIAPVHPAELVVEEEAHVLGEGGLVDHRGLAFAIGGPHRPALEVAPFLVGVHVVALRAIHPWEHHGELGLVNHLRAFARIGDHIGVIDGMAGVLLHEVLRVPSIVFVAHHALAFLDLVYRCVHGVTIFSFIGIGRIPELPDEQRTIAVLLPVQVAHEVEYVLRVVLIDRRVRQAADDRHGIRAVADQDHRNPEYHRVRDHPTRALGPTQAEHDQRA